MLSITSYPSKSKRFVVKESWSPWNRFACYNSQLTSKHPYPQGKHSSRDRQFSDNLYATHRLKKKAIQIAEMTTACKIYSIKDDEYDFFSSPDRMGLCIRPIKLSTIDIQHGNSFPSTLRKRNKLVPVSVMREKLNITKHRKQSL